MPRLPLFSSLLSQSFSFTHLKKSDFLAQLPGHGNNLSFPNILCPVSILTSSQGENLRHFQRNVTPKGLNLKRSLFKDLHFRQVLCPSFLFLPPLISHVSTAVA